MLGVFARGEPCRDTGWAVGLTAVGVQRGPVSLLGCPTCRAEHAACGGGSKSAGVQSARAAPILVPRTQGSGCER